MLQIRLSAKGVFSFARKPRQWREQQFASVVKGIHREVLADYVTGRMSPKLADRMQPAGFSIYGLKDRTPKYRDQQRRVLGVIRPYYSPRRLDFANVAKLVIKAAAGKGVNGLQLVQAVRGLKNQHRIHMYDLIKRPGIGWTVKTVGKATVRTFLKLPGARVLNASGPRGDVYRNQLLNLNLGGQRDKRGIKQEVFRRLQEWMPIFFRSQPKVPIRWVEA